MLGSLSVLTLILCSAMSVNVAASSSIPSVVRQKNTLSASLPTIPILMYHYIEDRDEKKYPKRANLFIPPVTFEAQLQWLTDHGYQTIDLDEMERIFHGDESAPAKAVVLTFDDGFDDNFKYAFPILKQYRFPATFFICPNLVGKKGYLGWTQIEEMQKDGLDIESHTMNHAYLPDLSRDQRNFEIQESKRVIEAKLGIQVDFLAYPIGGFTEEIKAETRQAGYQAGFTTNRGYNRFNKDVYELSRIRLSDNDEAGWRLWFKLSGYYNLFRKSKKSS